MPREDFIIQLKDEFSRGIRKAQAQTQKLRKSVAGISKGLTSAGSKLSLRLSAPLALLGGLAIKAASDFEETNAKFQTVFRDIATGAEASAKNLRDNFGLSETAAKDLLSGTGDLLTGFGFSQQSALDLSTEVQKLAVDLASFTNFAGGAEGASAALTKALLGERESVKSLGISILESDVKARVLINTQKGLTFESERQAKAFATLQIAQEQSKNAIGDFARTSAGFANQMRIARGRIQEVGVELGTILLPMATKVIGIVIKLAKKFRELSPAMKKTIVIIGGILLVLGPLLLILGKIIAIAPFVGAAFTIMTGPIGIIIVAIAGLVTLIVVMIKKWDEWGAAISLFLGPLGMVISIIQSFRRNWKILVATFKFEGIGAGLLKIGAILIDALLMPLQQLLEIASKIPGLGGIAGKGAAKISSLRKGLGVETGKKEGFGAQGEFAGAGGLGLGGVAGGLGGGPIVPAKPKDTGLKAGISEVRAGAPKTFNINIDSLVEKLVFNTQNLAESTNKIKEEVTKILLTAVNDVQIISR